MVLWYKTSSTIETMYIQWRKAQRQVLSLPFNTHCDLLPLIADNMPLEYILDCRYVSFYQTIVNSKNKIISYTARNKIFDCTSTLGKNITHLMHKYNLTIDDIRSHSKRNIKEHFHSTWLSGINNEYPMYAQIIKDMIEMKEVSGTRAFSNEESQIIIDYCCII